MASNSLFIYTLFVYIEINLSMTGRSVGCWSNLLLKNNIYLLGIILVNTNVNMIY
jgi:hypothetical protein